MKIKYLRPIDKYFCFFLCASLFIFKRFVKTLNFSDRQQINKILIIKFWGFGSIILAYDFFQLIRNKFPHAYVCALTLKQNSQIFKISGLFDTIIDLDIKYPTLFITNIIKIISYLRKESFDVSFDLEFTSRFSAIVSYLINAKKRIGFQYRGIWRGDCFTDVVQFQEDIKLKDSFFKLYSLVNKDLGILPLPLKLIIADTEKAFIDSLLKEECLLNAKPIIGININASELCLLRRWPKEYFVVLAEELIKIYSAYIIFIGSQEDSEYVKLTISLIHPSQRKHVFNFTGRVSLTQLFYLMSKFNLFISNDSGPLHLATYLKIPTVSFFGPETPLLYGPQGEFDMVFYKNFNCSPCIRVKNYKHAQCEINQRCLREIKPDEVLNEIKRKGLL